IDLDLEIDPHEGDGTLPMADQRGGRRQQNQLSHGVESGLAGSGAGGGGVGAVFGFLPNKPLNRSCAVRLRLSWIDLRVCVVSRAALSACSFWRRSSASLSCCSIFWRCSVIVSDTLPASRSFI